MSVATDKLAVPSTERLRVFISYSRDDIEFADQLVTSPTIPRRVTAVTSADITRSDRGESLNSGLFIGSNIYIAFQRR